MYLLFPLTILFTLIAWVRLPLAVLLLTALLPAYLLRANFFVIPTTMLELMLLSVIVVWLIQNRRRARELFVLEKKWAIAVALVVVAATMSAIVASDTLSAFGIWKAYFIEPILFFYVLVDLLRRKQITSDRLLSVMLSGGVFVALVALVQLVTGEGIPIPWDIERRVTGVFDYPNALGLYLGPLAVVAFAYIIHPSVIAREPIVDRSNLTRTRRDCFVVTSFLLAMTKRALDCFGRLKNSLAMTRMTTMTTGLLFTIVLILAKSEASLAALFVTLVVMGIAHISYRKWTITILIILSIVSFTIPSSRSYLFEKATLQDTSGQVRLSQWSETWELLKDKPIFGAGLSGYPTALAPYHKDTHIEIFQYPHNIFLNIWTELGLLGLITFVFFVIFIFLFPPSSFLLPFSLPLLQMTLHGLLDVPYFKNDLAVLTWIFLALLYAEYAKHHSTAETRS